MRPRSNGFTLVEMMVALFIFGLMASASVVLLRQSVEAENASRERLSDMGALRRLNALLAQDLEALVPVVTRDATGNPRSAFAVDDAADGLFAFSRLASPVEPVAGLSSVQRVRYGFENGALTRGAALQADGAEAEPMLPVYEGLGRVTLRFRDKGGLWQDRWQPQRQDEVPVAVELSLFPEAGGEPLVLRFLTGGRP